MHLFFVVLSHTEAFLVFRGTLGSRRSATVILDLVDTHQLQNRLLLLNLRLVEALLVSHLPIELVLELLARALDPQILRLHIPKSVPASFGPLEVLGPCAGCCLLELFHFGVHDVLLIPKMVRQIVYILCIAWLLQNSLVGLPFFIEVQVCSVEEAVWMAARRLLITQRASTTTTKTSRHNGGNTMACAQAIRHLIHLR